MSIVNLVIERPWKVVNGITKDYASGQVNRADAITQIAAVIRSDPPDESGPDHDDIRPLRATNALMAAWHLGRVDEDMVDAILDAVSDQDR